MRINLRKLLTFTLILALAVVAVGQARRGPKSQPRSFDVIVKGGTIYEWHGSPTHTSRYRASQRNRIAAVGNLSRATAADGY